MCRIFTGLLLLLLVGACGGSDGKEQAMATDLQARANQATFGAGCFWCVEAVFEQVAGVSRVVSGYAGGTVADPTYEQVCAGTTGHAEVCMVSYDPQQVSFRHLLEVFWQTHDPTTLNRQGADVGPQYRSIVLYHTEEQRQQAEQYCRELDAAEIWPDRIVTEIASFTTFYPAEGYHQDFYARNRGHQYCRLVIQPKLEKFRTVFAERLKE